MVTRSRLKRKASGVTKKSRLGKIKRISDEEYDFEFPKEDKVLHIEIDRSDKKVDYYVESIKGWNLPIAVREQKYFDSQKEIDKFISNLNSKQAWDMILKADGE